MLEISTSAQCPICEKHWLDYENGKFVCKECKSVVDINTTHGNYTDLYELNIPYTSVKFDNRLEKLLQLCDKYDIDFIGFDLFDEIKGNNYSGMCDIGWENGWPDNLPIIVKELKRILR